jgi:adenosine deaminase
MMAALGPRVRRLSALHSHLSCCDTDVEPAANAGAPRFVPQSEDRTNQVMRINHIARALPKTELHLHLDGSITPGFICRAAERRGIELPPEAELPAHIDDLRAADAAARPADGQKTMEAGKNWGIFDWMCQFLQTEWELEEGTKTLMESLAQDNVFYAEIRFCPELHTLEGLDLDQIVQAVCRGLTAGCEATGGAIRGGVVVCCLKSFSAEHSLEHAQLAHRYLSQGVVGFDAAGDEHFMLSLHEEAYKYCIANGVPCTAHGGEVMAESDPGAMLPNLELALDLGAWLSDCDCVQQCKRPQGFLSRANTAAHLMRTLRHAGVTRIGHGFAFCQSEELTKRAAAQGVTIEVCLPICLNPRFAWYAGGGENPYAKHP